MKAIVQDEYGSADVLHLRDVDNPVLGPGDVLVAVRAAGVDQGVWHLMTGLPLVVRPALGIRRPKVAIRGRDVAGVVEAVGPEVMQFKAGDEVFGVCEGSFAEYALARVDRLVRKPARLSWEQAAAAPISGLTALQAVRDAGKVQAGQSVLVIGASGGVGTFAVQLAKQAGARVTGVCSTSKVDLVRALGADEAIDYSRHDVTSGGQRYDVVLDIAGRRPLSLLRGIMAPRGVLVLIGGEGGDRWLGGLDKMLRAMVLSPFVGQRLVGLISSENQQDLQALRALLDAGPLTPVVDRTYPLAEAPAAITYMREGRARGKVVVTL